ncbi:MAG: type II toxin-antitoxin system HipA family toxin YjjJ [Rhodoferax sp.]
MEHPQAAMLLAALSSGPQNASALLLRLGVSQPTLSRLISALGPAVLRIRSGRSIHYAARDSVRGLGDMPVYRVDAQGRVARLGLLVPVRDEGFVMLHDGGRTEHFEGLPWWLVDMRPQGFMGRAYATRNAQALGLPRSIAQWTDTHALRALLAHGYDTVGDLLLGDWAREHFVHSPAPTPLAAEQKAAAYPRLANDAAGADPTWSSAGGEQPKFAAYACTAQGPRHLIVKFSVADDNPVSERWRDLLLAEYHALETLRISGVAAAHTGVVDIGKQRFLEVERFDRTSAIGRQGVVSLAALDAEYAGLAREPWPVVTQALALGGHITPQAQHSATLLYAFGTLIGNTDMHHGNLSFMSTPGEPYPLAPAYDMLPMGLQPRAGGALGDTLSPATLHPAVPSATWVPALRLAQDYLQRLRSEPRFSPRFAPCLHTLQTHLTDAGAKLQRLL